MPKIGIAVTTYRRPEHLALCLAQIYKHTPMDTVVYVTDDSLECKGIAYRKNECLNALWMAGCEYFFLLDDDCFPVADDWCETFIALSRRTGQHHLLVVPLAHTDRISDGLRISDEAFFGVLLFLTREAVQKVGGFYEGYGRYGYEHIGYSRRIHKAGLTPRGKSSGPDNIETKVCALDLYTHPVAAGLVHRTSLDPVLVKELTVAACPGLLQDLEVFRPLRSMRVAQSASLAPPSPVAPSSPRSPVAPSSTTAPPSPVAPEVQRKLTKAEPIYIRSLAPHFEEYEQALRHTLIRRGYQVIGEPAPQTLEIIMGLNVWPENLPLPARYIAIQLEQRGTRWFDEAYFARLRGAMQVWDYSRTNLEYLRQRQILALYVPLGWSPTWRYPKCKRDIDVLLLGDLSGRRSHMLELLKARGVKVQACFNHFGADKAKLLARTKVVLNIHYYKRVAPLEETRILPALAAGCKVVSEPSEDTELQEVYAGQVLFATNPSGLAAACRQALASGTPTTRSWLRTRSFGTLFPWDLVEA
jgi:hypothetical protein